jgi:zinc and cadmium transporter
MENFYYALGAAGIVSLMAFAGILTMALTDKILNKILFALVGFSAGAMIGGAFFHLIPEAVEGAGGDILMIFVWIVIGFSVFFLLERFIKWRHCHSGHCHVHSFAYMNLIGDGVHNFIDGLVIVAAFLVDVKLGIVTTLTIILHEIPQEIGDFGVIVYAGISKWKALFYNFVSALMAIAGVVVGYLVSDGGVTVFSEALLPFAAGGFIYIAASDLIPELHREEKLSKALCAFALFVVGVVFMLLVKLYGAS